MTNKKVSFDIVCLARRMRMCVSMYIFSCHGNVVTCRGDDGDDGDDGGSGSGGGGDGIFILYVYLCICIHVALRIWCLWAKH